MLGLPLQESVELGALLIVQSFGEESENFSLRPRHCLRTEPFDDCNRRQYDQAFPKFLHNRLSENKGSLHQTSKIVRLGVWSASKIAQNGASLARSPGALRVARLNKLLEALFQGA